MLIFHQKVDYEEYVIVIAPTPEAATALLHEACDAWSTSHYVARDYKINTKGVWAPEGIMPMVAGSLFYDYDSDNEDRAYYAMGRWINEATGLRVERP